MKRVFSVFISIIMCLSLLGCGEERTAYTGTGYFFDTVVNFCFYGSHAKEAISACLELAEKYDNLWNKSTPSSDISRINASEGAPTEISDETLEILLLAMDFAYATDGACSPTIGAISSLWDFKSLNPSLPEEEALKESLKHIDYKNIEIKGNTVTLLDKEISLDLGFIAKGYAADKMKELAISMGVNSGWINLGGNVLAIGSKPDKSSFNIGIQNPDISEGGSATVVSVTDNSVVTSGVYERCFDYEGEHYFHILDTKTGYPVRNNLLSVSVIGPSSAVCDGLSTTLFVLGQEEGTKFLDAYPDYEAIFITDDFVLHYTY